MEQTLPYEQPKYCRNSGTVTDMCVSLNTDRYEHLPTHQNTAVVSSCKRPNCQPADSKKFVSTFCVPGIVWGARKKYQCLESATNGVATVQVTSKVQRRVTRRITNALVRSVLHQLPYQQLVVFVHSRVKGRVPAQISHIYISS